MTPSACSIGLTRSTRTARHTAGLRRCATRLIPNDPRCKALARAVNRKSDSMNATEQEVLASFPEHGIDLGFWSRALTFAPAVANWPVKRHAALVSLVRLGRLGICIGTRDGQRVEILTRIA